jgi:hypothetical protein
MKYHNFELLREYRKKLFIVACVSKLGKALTTMEQESIKVAYKIINGEALPKEMMFYRSDFYTWKNSRKIKTGFLREMQTALLHIDRPVYWHYVKAAFRSMTERDEATIEPFCACFENTVIGDIHVSQATLNWASDIYHFFKFDTSPIFADVLEDEGFPHQGALDHLRQAKEHVRGCYVYESLIRGS